MCMTHKQFRNSASNLTNTAYYERVWTCLKIAFMFPGWCLKESRSVIHTFIGDAMPNYSSFAPARVAVQFLEEGFSSFISRPAYGCRRSMKKHPRSPSSHQTFVTILFQYRSNNVSDRTTFESVASANTLLQRVNVVLAQQ